MGEGEKKKKASWGGEEAWETGRGSLDKCTK